MKDVPLLLTVANYNAGMPTEERKAVARDLKTLAKPQRRACYQQVFITATRTPILALKYAQLVLKWDA